MVFSALFDLKSVHARRTQSALKTIQKPICVARCVANEARLRGEEDSKTIYDKAAEKSVAMFIYYG